MEIGKKVESVFKKSESGKIPVEELQRACSDKENNDETEQLPNCNIFSITECIYCKSKNIVKRET